MRKAGEIREEMSYAKAMKEMLLKEDNLLAAVQWNERYHALKWVIAEEVKE